MRTVWAWLGVAGLAMLSACGGDGWSSQISVAEAEIQQTADYSYLIPAGSGDAIDRGEKIEILPGDLTAEVGQILEIVNEDDRGHLVGPFFVGAGETLRQEFVSPGVFEGVCTVHPSGQFVLTVV